MASFVISKRINGDYQFNLKADNGQILITSEGYYSKVSCINGVESVRSNSSNPEQFELRKTINDSHYFNLKARNGQIIASSQMYSSEGAARDGINAVMSIANIAQILDNA